jgi:hypothetical protein
MSLGYLSSIIYFIYHSNNAILFINYIGIYIYSKYNKHESKGGGEKKEGGGMEERDREKIWRGERRGERKGRRRRRRGGHGSRCQHTSLSLNPPKTY